MNERDTGEQAKKTKTKKEEERKNKFEKKIEKKSFDFFFISLCFLTTIVSLKFFVLMIKNTFLGHFSVTHSQTNRLTHSQTHRK